MAKKRSRPATNGLPRAHGFGPLTAVFGVFVSGCSEAAMLKMCRVPVSRSMVRMRPLPCLAQYRYVCPLAAVAMVGALLLLPPPAACGQPPVVTSIPSPTWSLWIRLSGVLT
jgi:hypothetical protein